jgi:peptidoglycan/LPS O-acetylase OafA/YrhL
MRHRLDIDGLRALAVIPVVLFHAQLGFPGGYTGVDIFFVISGFLITKLLLQDMEANAFSFKKFWERRIRRIMPALAVLLTFVLLAGYFILVPSDYRDLGWSTVSQLAFSSNFYFWRESGYFDKASDFKPLLHTWSLAVEEQFYFLFPLLLFQVRSASRSCLVKTLLTLGALSFCLSVYLSYYHRSVNFYFLPPRAWELLLGSCIAAGAGAIQMRQLWREVLSAGGLVMVLVSFIAFHSSTRFPGANALLPCAGAGLIIWTGGTGPTRVGRFLGSAPLVFVGLISYSLYLWHWPLFAFLKYRVESPGVISRLLTVCLSFCAAYVSWKFVEQPFRSRVLAPSRGSLFKAALASSMAIASLGFCVASADGFRSRLRSRAQIYADAVTNFTFLNVSTDDVKKGRLPPLGQIDSRKKAHVLLWGDSHAMALAPALDEVLRKHSAAGVQATYAETVPLLGYVSQGDFSLARNSTEWNAAIVKYVEHARITDVVMVACWNSYLAYREDYPGVSQSFMPCLIRTVSTLRKAGARVWLVKEVPHPDTDPPHYLALKAMRTPVSSDTLPLPVVRFNETSQAEDAAFGNVTGAGVEILNPAPFLLVDLDHILVARQEKCLYRDRGHLSVEGAKLLQPLFEPLFTE